MAGQRVTSVRFPSESWGFKFNYFGVFDDIKAINNLSDEILNQEPLHRYLTSSRLKNQMTYLYPSYGSGGLYSTNTNTYINLNLKSKYKGSASYLDNNYIPYDKMDKQPMELNMYSTEIINSFPIRDFWS